MPLLTLFVSTITFVIIAFTTSQEHGAMSAFSAYFSLESSFIIANSIFFIIGVIVLTILFIRSIKLDNSHPFHDRFIFPTVQVLGGVIVGFFLSFVFLLIVALIELNVISVLISVNPSTLGLQTDISHIVSSLQSDVQPPEIIATDRNVYKEVLAVATATTGSYNLYGTYMLSSIPPFLVNPVQKKSSRMLLLDNTLIITEINPTDMQAISPVIGYLFVHQYFPTKNIRTFPKITIMNRQQYVKYRGVDAYVKLAKIDEEINTIESTIGSLSGVIQTDNNILSNNQNLVSSAVSQREAAYQHCLSDSSSSSVTCKNMLNQLQSSVQSGNADMNSISQQMQQAQDQLSKYEYYNNFFNTQKKLVENLKANMPHELGVFEPPNKIKVVIDSTNSHAIADYFETVTHEYLHYASYVKGKTFTDAFFEEGLTEYFARRAIKDNLNMSTNLGYPVFVKIISEMTNIIPESELADIYFTKDENRLEATLDRVYGDDFYNNNHITFETLPYSSDSKQTLKLANDIMKQIGGSPLTEKDLYSSYSSL